MAVIVDSGGNLVLDAATRAAIGAHAQGMRVVRALPMQSVEILTPCVMTLPTGNREAVLASPRVHVHRMVGATRD